MSPTVQQLLTDARSHEQQRRDCANRRQGPRPTPDYPQATLHAQQALDARRQAHEIDPNHTDPAWQGDRLSHEDHIKWLADYVSRP